MPARPEISGLTLAGLAIAALFVVGVGWQWWSKAPKAPKPLYTIRGTMTLMDSNLDNAGRDHCRGAGGFSDVQPGKQVTVLDAAGTVIGVGELGMGRPDREHPMVVCVFEFEIPNLPAADFYGIEMQGRGTLRYSREEMQRRAWSVAFSLSGGAR